MTNAPRIVPLRRHGLRAFAPQYNRNSTAADHRVGGCSVCQRARVFVGESIAKPRVLKRIEELADINREIQNRIYELEGLVDSNALGDEEFNLLRQMLSMFSTSIDGMSIEEKRAAIRTVVRKVVWDGVNAHVVLFGADEGEIEFPDMVDRMAHIDEESGEEDILEAFLDVDYEDFESDNAANDSKNPWGEDSK